MKIQKKKKGDCVRLSAEESGEEMGAMYLYLIRNDSHKEPYALLEDLLVKEEYRKRGIGTALIKEALAEAKRLKCYKIIGTSRNSRTEVHRFYEKLGFKKYGVEFRIDL